MRAGLLLFFIVLAGAGPAAMAAGAASAPVAFDQPCVGVGGTAAADADDPAGMSTFVVHGKAAVDLVAKELGKRQVRTSILFRVPPDSHEQSQRTFEWLMRTHCTRYVDITFVAKKDASGPYIGYDVRVAQFVFRAGAAGQNPTLGADPVFSRQYHHPRTVEALARFDPAQDAARIVADLLAGASLPKAP